SAEALADDLHYFLDGEPIRARPVAAWERLLRSARRRPALVARALCAAALLCALLVAGWNLRVADRVASQRAEEKYQKFVLRRDEALVYGLLAPDEGTLFLGAAPAANLGASESAAREALALAGVQPDSDAPAVDPSLPPQRRPEVAEDCYALLLV